ncbi:hypothetical protein [Deinococcus hohokamensis]|uniref:Uncharacterized protein n=1 Tax=Deinococcus hohokamensis TaxID=309883 RepID=A0ABV9I6J7_9DEIO
MTRAPLKLSREMKILLVLLLMVGLIGLWYVLTGNRTADEAVSTPPATGQGNTAAGNPGAGGTDASAGQGSQGAGTAGQGSTDASGAQGGTDTTPLSVAPDGPVDVEVIPPFPVNEAGNAGAGGSEVTAPPSGINPNTVLAGVPGSNPFRPLRLDQTGATSGGTSTPSPSATFPGNDSPGTGSSGQSTGGFSGSANTGSGSGSSDFGTTGAGSSSSDVGSGPVAITPVPGASGSVNVPSASVSGGVLPPPIIPGADDSTGGVTGAGTASSGATGGGAASGVTSGAAPSVTIRPGGSVTGLPGTAGTGSGTSANAGGATTTPAVRPPAAPKPPVAGVQVPSVAQVPTIPGAAGNTGATGSTGAGTAGTGGTGTSGTGAGDVPAVTTPQVITELGAAAGTPAASAPSPLDQLVQAQDLAFNAVVLGPVNTAIFRSRSGFVVVSVGQKLPDTNVTVRDVTATSATLALGNETKTLELDKR